VRAKAVPCVLCNLLMCGHADLFVGGFAGGAAPLPGAPASQSAPPVSAAVILAMLQKAVEVKEKKEERKEDGGSDKADVQTFDIKVGDGEDGIDGDIYPLYKAFADAGYGPEEQLPFVQSEQIPKEVLDIMIAKSRKRPEPSAALAAARVQCRALVKNLAAVVAEIVAERERKAKAEADAAAKAAWELAQQLDRERQAKLRRLGTCSAGFQWHRVAGGYVCGGGGRSFSDAQIDQYAH
jgi:hypothetical protein